MTDTDNPIDYTKSEQPEHDSNFKVNLISENKHYFYNPDCTSMTKYDLTNPKEARTLLTQALAELTMMLRDLNNVPYDTSQYYNA